MYLLLDTAAWARQLGNVSSAGRLVPSRSDVGSVAVMNPAGKHIRHGLKTLDLQDRAGRGRGSGHGGVADKGEAILNIGVFL